MTKNQRTSKQSTSCYWCGKEVLAGEGAREHIIPKTLMQDAKGDISDFVIPQQNSHKSCNQILGNAFEHDFCQILFFLSFGDPKAQKHNTSKIRNLWKQPKYTASQFAKMQQGTNHTEVSLTEKDKAAFEEVIKKILKGLYFKKFNQHLDLNGQYLARIVWDTVNIEQDSVAAKRFEMFLEMLNDEPLIGNEVFKFRFKKTSDGDSFLWEFVFYGRFPVYVFLTNKNETL